MEAIDYLRSHQFTVADFHKMAEIGVFREDTRLELIQGGIVEMAPIGSKHAGIVNWLTANLSRSAKNRAIVGTQNPVVLNDKNELYPDLSVLKPTAKFYTDVHPHPKDVLLLIEVSDTTLGYDQRVKIPLYAKNGILETWIIDIENHCIHVYREHLLQYSHYQQMETVREGLLSIQADPSIQIDVTDLFKACLS